LKKIIVKYSLKLKLLEYFSE